jgi:hypothetical protein
VVYIPRYKTISRSKGAERKKGEGVLNGFQSDAIFAHPCYKGFLSPIHRVGGWVKTVCYLVKSKVTV